MAPPRGGLKGIYRQRKKVAGAAKSPPKCKSKKGKPQQQCQDGADALDYTAEEEQLRQFDMDMSYGPCIGVTRLRRSERAAALGLRPPPHLRDLILHAAAVGSSSPPPPPRTKNDASSSVSQPQLECIWAGKV